MLNSWWSTDGCVNNVMAFHHGSLSRLQAEEILLASRQDGSFLVRDSETIPGAYTLCMLYQQRVHQYRILPEEGKIYVQAEKGVEARRYANLTSLIADYQLRGTNNGLVCPLKYPIGPNETKEEDSDDEIVVPVETHTYDEVPLPDPDQIPPPPVGTPRSPGIPIRRLSQRKFSEDITTTIMTTSLHSPTSGGGSPLIMPSSGCNHNHNVPVVSPLHFATAPRPSRQNQRLGGLLGSNGQKAVENDDIVEGERTVLKDVNSSGIGIGNGCNNGAGINNISNRTYNSHQQYPPPPPHRLQHQDSIIHGQKPFPVINGGQTAQLQQGEGQVKVIQGYNQEDDEDTTDRGGGKAAIVGGGKRVSEEKSASSLPGATKEPASTEYMDYEPFVTRYFLQRFAQLDLSTVDGEFLEGLKDYTDHGVHQDAHKVAAGAVSPPGLSKLLVQATAQLHRDMDNFLHRVDTLRQLFGPLSNSPLCSNKREKPEETAKNVAGSIEELQTQLTHCKAAVTYLERKAVKRFQDLASPQIQDDEYANPDDMSDGQTASPATSPEEQEKKSMLQPHTFDAKLVKSGNKQSLVCITVDIQSGKVKILRPNKDVLEDVVVYHYHIRQIIKSTKDSCRLEFLADARKKETYVFDTARNREHFCQMIKQVKIMHATYQDVASVSVFIGTFNMGDESPPPHLARWLRCEGVGKSRNPGLVDLPHDIYVIGTQECGISEKDWTNKIRATIADKFKISLHVVASVTLWAIRLLILVKQEYKNKISHVQTSSVKTGIANTLGNKGAAGASFQFNGTSMAFICCHLTSGAEKNHRRNQNFRDIMRNLNLGPKNLQNVFDTSNQFHHLFVLGDLNYRLEGMEAESIIKTIQTENNNDLLLSIDQLKRSQDKKEAFYGFEEEEITFPPTYRIEKGTVNTYAWKKLKKTGVRINVPSWCDRIVWRSYPNTDITNTSYGCNTEVTTSDHKPVFASFDISITGQYVPTKHCDSTPEVIIRFEEVTVEVKTTSSEHFCLEFHSSCLANMQRSNQNQHFSSSQPGFCAPKWSKDSIPELVPLQCEQNYLEDQHILIAVKTADGLESYGECVLGLQDRFSICPTSFSTDLMHNGEVTGKISGYMHVKGREGTAPQFRNHRRRKSYEIIYMDTTSMGSFRAQKPRQHMQHMTSVPAETRKPEVKLRRKNSRSLEDMSAIGGSGSGSSRSRNNRWSNQIKQDDVFLSSSSTSINSNFSLNPHASFNQTAPIPAVRSSKPRLGRSSLAHSTVLPVSASGSNLAGIGAMAARGAEVKGQGQIHQNQSQQNLQQQPQLPAKSQQLSQSQFLQQQQQQQQQALGVGRRKVSPDTTHPPPPARVMMRNISSESDEGPPPPPRQYRDQPTTPSGASYVTLRRPQTVNEWLLNLGLPQYIQTFHDHGFDHLDKVMILRPLDLDTMNVQNKDHRERMLRSVNK